MTASSRQLGMEHLKSQIEFIKSCGIKVGVDCVDFASLDIVKSLTVDLVSLVPSLTGPIADNLTTRYMVEAVTSFTHKLGVRTCFTGIEDEEQLRMARQYPVSDLMGYYFGRPCRIEDFKRLSFLSK
jgi:EAL domain-containing protein (putative c-di-GMP-specific phosphodiesterase class I)